jgi:hypothetical protein
MPPTRDPARDLLFGLLALQTGLLNQAQLVAAFHAWTQAGGHPMAEILAGPGALSAPCLTLVERPSKDASVPRSPVGSKETRIEGVSLECFVRG